jgi:uncharacterized membrane protein YdjX (TVP38/TMEM64 family)
VTIPWSWIAVVAAGAVVLLVVLAGPATSLIQGVEAWLPGRGLTGVLLYAPIYALVPLLLMPATPFAIGAGLIFGFWLGLLAVMLGSVLTATSGFLLARFLFRGRLEARIRRRPSYAAVDRVIARDGWKTLGLLRLTWLHCGLINYAYGLSAMSYSRFIVISAVALVPGSAISVYLGAAGAVGYELFVTGEWERTTLEYVAIAGGVVAAIVVSVLMATRAKRAIEEMAGEACAPVQHMPLDGRRSA